MPDLADEVASAVGSRREARWVLQEVTSLGPTERRARALQLAARRAAGEPLQYVLGHWPFRGHDLLVDERALVPRPETEALVDLALRALGSSAAPRVAVDLGCGTGAIAVAIALEAQACGIDVEVHASDVDDDALSLAAQNLERTRAIVTLHKGSWYDALPPTLRGGVSVCCSNPPYVAASERPTLARELAYEPDRALFADDDESGPGMAAVSAVIEGAASWLAPGGVLLVEHGATQRAAALACASAAGLAEVVDHDDLAGLPRVLEARARLLR